MNKSSIRVFLGLALILMLAVSLFFLRYSVLYGRVAFASTADFTGEWVNAYDMQDATIAGDVTQGITQIENGDMALADFSDLVASLAKDHRVSRQKLFFRTPECYLGAVNRGDCLIVFAPPGACWVRLIKVNKLFMNVDFDIKDSVDERPVFQKAKTMKLQKFSIDPGTGKVGP